LLGTEFFHALEMPAKHREPTGYLKDSLSAIGHRPASAMRPAAIMARGTGAR
jgi:hypothetical protein